MRIAAVLVAALACAIAGAAVAARVVNVADGDSLTLLDGGREERVWLWGIDAPERGQPWSRASRDALARRAMHRDASVEPRGVDGFGRRLARVRVDGVDLAAAQVGDGMAWVFRRYTDDAARNLARREAGTAVGVARTSAERDARAGGAVNPVRASTSGCVRPDIEGRP